MRFLPQESRISIFRCVLSCLKVPAGLCLDSAWVHLKSPCFAKNVVLEYLSIIAVFFLPALLFLGCDGYTSSPC